MKKQLNFLLICITCCFGLNAQDPADTAFEKTVFWRITGNGLTDTSYLYGTAHPIFREDIHLSPNMLQALLRSPVIYFENIPSSNDDSLYRSLNIMKKPNLRRLLGNICYTKLITLLKKLDDPVLDDPMFEWMTPQYLSSKLMVNVFGKRLTSVDAILMAIALGNDQEIIALDRPGLRKEMVERFSFDQQATNLFYLVDNFEKKIESFTGYTKAMTEKYNSGDISFLYTRINYVRVNDRMYGSYTFRIPGTEDILDKRNKEWLPKIEMACRKQPTFFAFGAAHLGGKKGMITLLRKKGYVVSPVFGDSLIE